MMVIEKNKECLNKEELLSLLSEAKANLTIVVGRNIKHRDSEINVSAEIICSFQIKQPVVRYEKKENCICIKEKNTLSTSFFLHLNDVAEFLSEYSVYDDGSKSYWVSTTDKNGVGYVLGFSVNQNKESEG